MIVLLMNGDHSTSINNTEVVYTINSEDNIYTNININNTHLCRPSITQPFIIVYPNSTTKENFEKALHQIVYFSYFGDLMAKKVKCTWSVVRSYLCNGPHHTISRELEAPIRNLRLR